MTDLVPDEPSSVSASLHAGADAQVCCYAYPDGAPILAVSAGRMQVNISLCGRQEVPASAVAFARELARQAERFAAECERLRHALHPPAGEHADRTGAPVPAGDFPLNGGMAGSSHLPAAP